MERGTGGATPRRPGGRDLAGRGPAPAGLGGSPIVAALAITAFAGSLVLDLHLATTGPLWLDESWTGAFASEPTLAGLTDQVRNDANAPLYYYVMWFWARAFGVSDLSLHVPGLLFSIATPVVAWGGLRRSHPRAACIWAGLLALWYPGIVQAGDARCYALLLCLSTAATAAATRAFAGPTRGRAIRWAVLACLMTLTHYDAGLLALAQGLLLTVRFRGRFRQAWPATLVFLPAFAWIAWHAPRLADFARPGTSWYEPLTLADVPSLFWFFLGPPMVQVALAAALATSLVLRTGAGPDPGPGVTDGASLRAIGFASLGMACLCFALATLRPLLVLRYLTPFAPGILLLVATGLVAASRARWQPLAVLMGGSLLGVSLAVASEDVAVDKAYSFEQASAWLAESAPTRLAFFWDNPETRVEVPRQLDAIGGFFLRRAGLAVDVRPVVPVDGTDMTGPVLAAAGDGGAILWLYDRLVHDTTAAARPPHFGRGLECRDFGMFNVGVLACRRKP